MGMSTMLLLLYSRKFSRGVVFMVSYQALTIKPATKDLVHVYACALPSRYKGIDENYKPAK